MLLTSSLVADFFIFIATFLLVVYLYTSRRYDYWKKKGVPFKKPTPFLGSLAEVFTAKKCIGIFLRDLQLETKGPYLGLFVLDRPHLFVKDPEIIKSVLVENFSQFCDRSVVSKNMHDTLGSHMMFFMKSPDWGNYRRKMTPLYTSGKIKAMYGLFEETRNLLIDYMNYKLDKSSVLDVKQVATRYSTELITSTAFGIKANALSDLPSEFMEAGRNILDFNNLRAAFAWGCYMLAPSLVDLFRIHLIDPDTASFLRGVFWETMKEREESKSLRNDIIDILLQMKKNGVMDNDDFDGDKMLAQAVIFFLGGFETTATTISFALYELANNPDVQTKLREEINEVVKTHGKINYDLLTGGTLKYLDMVIKETLRKYPAVNFIDRMCNKAYKIPGTDIVLEEGTGVYISNIGLQMDPENFPNPEEFIPERFSEENADNIKPYTYLPFGAGPRNCIGGRFGLLSTQSALVGFIRNFEWELHEETPKKMEFHRRAALLAPLTGRLLLRGKKV